MKTTIKRRYLGIFLWLMVGSSLAAAQSPQQQAARLLDQLGVLPLLDQAPAVLAPALDAEVDAQGASAAQRAEWQHRLEQLLQTSHLRQVLVQYVADRYSADRFRKADDILQQPLIKRVGYFDLAMAQPGAGKNLRDYRGSPSPQRLQLAQQIDAATGATLLAATLQTAITEQVRRVAGAAASTPAELQARIAERERYLAPLTQQYVLYAYRYLRDDELTTYRDLMRDASLQWLLDVSREGLLATVAGLKPQPDPPQLP